MPFGGVRPLAPSDRGAAAAALGVPVAAFDHGLRVVVHDDGPAAGVAAWRADAGDVAELGGVVVSRGQSLARLFELVRGCALEASAAGFSRAAFEIHDEALLRVLEATFTLAAAPIGYAPLSPRDERLGITRRPVAWRIEVDLLDALAQLDRVLTP